MSARSRCVCAAASQRQRSQSSLHKVWQTTVGHYIIITSLLSFNNYIATLLIFSRENVFRFACSSRHCMCLSCFSNYCKQMLSCGGFSGFENMGYSVSCPGKGSDCANTPVPDPHHFKIVDDDLTFVSQHNLLVTITREGLSLTLIH